MDNTIMFKGFKQIDGTSKDFTENFEDGYLYFVRTDTEKEDGYIVFNGKKYGTANIIDGGEF